MNNDITEAALMSLFTSWLKENGGADKYLSSASKVWAQPERETLLNVLFDLYKAGFKVGRTEISWWKAEAEGLRAAVSHANTFNITLFGIGRKTQ